MRTPSGISRPAKIAAAVQGVLSRLRRLPPEPQPQPLAVLRGMSWDGIERAAASAGPKAEAKAAAKERARL